ncbi:MAG: hypothetical protein RL033_4803 [Pseudomonadota bacterium]|jgi:hypothetical protein
MDLVDRIETSRFLGGEFALWLWFSRDVMAGVLDIPGQGMLEVALESSLLLVDPLTDTERVTVRGFDPLASEEAERALLVGKLPRKVGLRIVFEQNEWIATIDAASFVLSGVKLPALLSEGEEEHFHERMRFLEQLHDLVQGLYRNFLRVRLSPQWEATLLPAMRGWVRGEVMERKDYQELHAPAVGTKRRRK